MTPFHILPQDNDVPASVSLDNTADVLSLALDGVPCIKLHFPKFTDGRAYSQAVVLRRRGFQGELRATGDVLLDQLLPLQRCGFSSAVLRADQDATLAPRLLATFAGFYQGDAIHRAAPFQAR